MSKFDRIKHPDFDSDAFGYVPAIAALNTKRAPIYLFKGEHFGGGAGLGRGFGEAHIRASHSHDLRRAKCQTVAQYLSRHIEHDSPICSEGNSSSKKRVVIMRISGVIVVLEYRQARDEDHWSVVTAFKRRKALKAKEICRVEGLSAQ